MVPTMPRTCQKLLVLLGGWVAGENENNANSASVEVEVEVEVEAELGNNKNNKIQCALTQMKFT